MGSGRRGRVGKSASADQERVLRAATDLSSETIAVFIPFVATDHAEAMLERAQRIDVRAKEFRRFAAALDGPAEEMPTLRRYARTSSQIPTA